MLSNIIRVCVNNWTSDILILSKQVLTSRTLWSPVLTHAHAPTRALWLAVAGYHLFHSLRSLSCLPMNTKQGSRTQPVPATVPVPAPDHPRSVIVLFPLPIHFVLFIVKKSKNITGFTYSYPGGCVRNKNNIYLCRYCSMYIVNVKFLRIIVL